MHAKRVRHLDREGVSRCDVMTQIADEMVRLLKTKSTSFVMNLNRSVDKLFISVQKDIFDCQVVRGLGSEREEVLVKSDSGPDTVAWLSRIRVSPDPWPSSVASVWVEANLQERSLTAAGEVRKVAMHKDLKAHVLPARLVPYRLDKHTQCWTPALPNPGTLDIGVGA